MQNIIYMNKQILKVISLSFFIFIEFHICVQAQLDNTCLFNIKNVKEKDQSEYLYESCIEYEKNLIEDSIRIAVINRSNEVTRFDMNSQYNNSYYRMFNSILSNMGLMQNFYFFSCQYFNNACATIINTDNGLERVVMIDNQFLDLLGEKHHSDYPAASIIAHEIAHHLNNHVLSDISVNRYKQEIEADEFSGFILNSIGATLDEALIAINYYASPTASSSHPGLTTRIEAIKRGYNNAQSKSKFDYEELNRIQLLDVLGKTNNLYSKIILYNLLENIEEVPANILSIIETKGLIYSAVNLNRNAILEFENTLKYAKKNNLVIDKSEIFLNLAECTYEINELLNSVEYCKLAINDLSATNSLKLQAKNLYLNILMELKCIQIDQAEKAFSNIFNSGPFPNKESSEMSSAASLESYKLIYQVDSSFASLLQGNINTDKDFFDLMQLYLDLQKYDACLGWTDFALNNIADIKDPTYKSYYEAKVYGYKATCLYLKDRINEAYDIVTTRKVDFFMNQFIADAIKKKLDIVDFNLLR